MVRKRMLVGLMLVAALALQIGCTAQVQDDGQQEQQGVQEDEQQDIMDEFNGLIDSDASLAEVIEFTDENIHQLSQENASAVVDELENLQKENLPELDEKFYSDQEVQNEIREIYEPGFDVNIADQLDDGKLKSLLTEARDTGYKVETAEGTYFLIMDYSFYKKYSEYVTEDLRDYIEIMAIESSKVPAKDAGLVIGWDEIVERAMLQDKFLRDYSDSIKKDEVKELYKKYVTFTLLGLNNTPLFKYDTKTMNEEAKAAYMQAAESDESGGYIQLLKEYLKVLEQNDYKLTDQVDEYRKGILENI